MAINIQKSPKVSLSKVVLKKSGDSHQVNLKKNTETITINLNWTQQKNQGLFANLFNKNKEIDLDLGCFYELRNGQASVIDGIQFSHNRGGAKHQQTQQGCYTKSPWIWHCGDDRGSSQNSGENILVNPNGIKDIRRIIVYCFIYDGIAKWGESDAVITVKVPNYPEIIVEMGKQLDHRSFCAIAELTFDQYSNMSVRKLLTFHSGHKDCDQYYDWGFQWSPGSK